MGIIQIYGFQGKHEHILNRISKYMAISIDY